MAVSTLLRRVGRLLTNPSEGDQLVLIGKGDRKPPKQVDMGNSGIDEYRHGKLILESLFSTFVEVIYVPSQQKLEQSGLNASDAAPPRVKLLDIDGET